MEPSFLTVCRQQLSNPPSVFGIHPSFDLLFFVISCMTFILCCLVLSSSSVDSSCLLCRRCKLYSLNKAKILAQQSSLHFSYPVLPASSYTTPFQKRASASASLSFAVLDLVRVQNLFLHFLCQLLTALIHLLLTHMSLFPCASVSGVGRFVVAARRRRYLMLVSGSALFCGAGSLLEHSPLVLSVWDPQVLAIWRIGARGSWWC